jgi:hypothetical protein
MTASHVSSSGADKIYEPLRLWARRSHLVVTSENKKGLTFR